MNSARCQGTLIAKVGTETVRVVYSDESLGNRIDWPITVVAALMMNMDAHWPAVESELKKIRSETPPLLLYEGREFKGSVLYSAVRKVERLRAIGKTDPDLKTLEKARGILLRILAVPVANPAPIVYGAVDVVGYDKYQKLHPPDGPATDHDLAFDSCLARMDNIAHAELRKDEQLLWIHDHRGKEGEEETKFGLTWVKFLKQAGWDPTDLKYAGLDQPPVRVVETIYFGHSHDSLAIQLADVCCSTIGLKLIERFYPNVLTARNWQPLVEPFYSVIQPGVMNDGSEPLFRELALKLKEPSQ